jgi:hypothetical protein
MDNVSTKAVMTRTVAIFREHTAKPRELQILKVKAHGVASVASLCCWLQGLLLLGWRLWRR